ncbi:MAG: S9 family peptidase [Bacteroidales bacterium]|nr:S9 family peptidase [Bacteroidales bacterium]
MRKSIFLSLVLFLSTTILFSQKKVLDHTVYDSWKSLTNTNVDDKGNVITSLIAPQEGDTTLFIQRIDPKNSKLGSSKTFERVTSYRLSSDGRWTIALIKAPLAERRQARIDKKKKEDMPQDSLLIIDNLTFETYKIPGVKSYKTANEFNSHITYTVSSTNDSIKNSAKQKDVLILHNLLTQEEDSFRNSKEHIFNKYGNSFVVIIEPDSKDTTDYKRVVFKDLKLNNQINISNESLEYKSLAFNEEGTQLVYLASADTSKIVQKAYDIRYYTTGADSAIIIADSNAKGLPNNWLFNENASPSFSKDGARIMVGAAPPKQPKDTTIVDFEMAQLDIWHWQDPVIQPQQLKELKREESRTYQGLIYTNQNDEFIPLASENMPYVSVSNEGNGKYALIWSNLPYLLESQWDLSSKTDVMIVDLDNMDAMEVGKPLNGRPSFSPQGNYIYWWDDDARHWFTHDNRNGIVKNLTQDIEVNFWDERNDVPRTPGSYGIASWGENDEFILINDMFDIWKIYPSGVKKAENISLGKGRTDSITFRYVNLDTEKRFIEPQDELLLSAFNNISKEKGYYTLKQSGRNPLKERVMDKFNFTGLLKAKDSDLMLFQKSNFSTSPNLHVTSNLWKSSSKLTDINPQMSDYNWGTAELFSWTSFADVPLQGIIYKPEDFDPSKKYPVMIYFYEKHSDNLYSYMTPAPSRSTVNIPFFVSRGYVVFTPDIDYTVGQPGMDAYNSVVSGAEELIKFNWVDAENMAIQGQSWGGYQVAYLITKTNMFKAAGSGAPVSNMTSAYGGIRWGTGRSRQYQYEKTQSRLGSTLSDSLDLYIKNSPVFFVKDIETPLLIMHNDNDGAVPWYQGIEMYMSMRRLGKPVWMLQYNNEDHNLIHRRNSKDLAIRLQQFFDHYLKGEPAPVWMTSGVPATDKGITWGYDID